MNDDRGNEQTEAAARPDAETRPAARAISVGAVLRNGRPAESGASPSLIFDVQGLRVFYGSFQAVADTTMAIREHEITALIGPSGCGKTTVLRCFNRMNDLIETRPRGGHRPLPRGGHLRREGRPGRGAAAHRHGLPEAQSLPQVDLRQHRLRAPHRRLQGQHGRPGRGVADPGGPVGRGEGQAASSRPTPCRAASSSASASPGPSPPAPTCCSWTSPAPRSTPSPRCASRS